MLERLKITTSALALMAGAVVAAPGYAADAPAADKSANTLEEIVVTAQKRSENLQQVPLSVTAIDATTAKNLGVLDTTDLESVTPGLIAHHQGGAFAPVLRGISTQQGATTDESPVSTYVDGVYLVSAYAGVFALNDIDRVEVLKGPQGTLFGRNAVGGVINVITRDPKQTPEMEMSASYANYNTDEATFYGTTGISPIVAVSLSAYWHKQYEGYGKYIQTPGTPGPDPIAGQGTFLNDETALRNKWLITPTDKTRITLSIDYDKGDNGLGTVRRLLPGTFLTKTLFPNDPGPQGSFWDAESTYPAITNYRQWGLSAKVEQDLGWATLKSITAYRDTYWDFAGDQANVSIPYFVSITPTTVRQTTQEFQLASPDSSRIKWIVGAYGLSVRDINDSLSIGSINGPQNYGSYSDVKGYETSKSLAAFGDVTVPIGEKSHVTAGIRYTDDTQHIESDASTNNVGKVPTPAFQNSDHFAQPTWRLGVDHEFTESVMTYFSYNRGYKSGLFNNSNPTSPLVRPEFVDAFEVGIKSQLFDNKLRFNAAAFYYADKDFQITVINLNPLTNTIATFVYNAATGQEKGVDVDVEAVPFEHVTLRFGAEYLDAVYTKLLGAQVAVPNPLPAGGVTVTTEDASGSSFLYTPRWTANASVLYNLPTEVGNFNFALNYYYHGSDEPYINSFRQPGYSIWNASTEWSDPAKPWALALWVKNLTNTEYYNSVSVSTNRVAGASAPPRTYGITLKYKWGG